MNKDFKRILHRYGQEITLCCREKIWTGRAILQPLFEKQEQRSPTPMGRQWKDRFLCLADCELPLGELGEDGFAACGGQRYEVVTAQAVRLGEKELYQWAVLKPRDPEVEQ